MFVKPFGYERAASLEEACDLLRGYGGEARVIAGGQSLLPMVNLGIVEPAAVVDISRVQAARGVVEVDGFLRIHALTRHLELESDELVRRHQPLLAAAARNVGNPRARARGTLGGSLSHADPAAELPLAMTVLGAEYELTDGRAVRSVPAAEFALTYFTTQLGEAELLSSATVPKLGPGWGWSFQEVCRRRGDFAVVSVAALVRCADGEIVEARVGLGGVSERPMRAAGVEVAVAGAHAGEIEARVGQIQGIQPVTDTSATAELRLHLARVLTVRALVEACGRCEEEP